MIRRENYLFSIGAIVLSVFLHVILLWFCCMVPRHEHSLNSYLVLGLHSVKTGHAYFMPLKAPRVRVKKPKPSAPKKNATSASLAQGPSEKSIKVKKNIALPDCSDEQPPKQAEPKERMPQEKTASSYAIYEKEIQEAVARVWAPPVGVPKGVECVVEVTFDTKGTVATFTMLKRSNILIYDMSVMQIIKKISLGERFYNKTLPIYFRQ